MPRASSINRKEIVEILSASFLSNPSVNWVVKKDKKIEQRIKALCRYSFETANLRNGAFISSDRNGAALCYRYNSQKEGLMDYWNQFLLAVNAIGLFRVPEVLQREAYAKRKRPISGDYLYFWFLGVKPEYQDGSAARELRNEIFSMADENNLPIYLETSVEKNKRAYLRFGFELYHTWEVKEKGIHLYFMRRMPLNK